MVVNFGGSRIQTGVAPGLRFSWRAMRLSSSKSGTRIAGSELAPRSSRRRAWGRPPSVSDSRSRSEGSLRISPALARRRIAKSLTPSFLQSFDHLPVLRIVRALVVVPEPLLRVASPAGDREVLELVGSAMILRDDVFDRPPVERGPIHSEGELLLAVNALALENLLPGELPALERPIGGGYR